MRKGKYEKRDLLSRLVTSTGTKGCASHVGAGCTFCPGWCYQRGQKVLFCPSCQTRDKRAPPFVPDWHSRLGNRDNRGFPTGTNQRFCSSVRLPYINWSKTWNFVMLTMKVCSTMAAMAAGWPAVKAKKMMAAAAATAGTTGTPILVIVHNMVIWLVSPQRWYILQWSCCDL